MKNSIDTIGKETHDLVACNAVPQPTAPPSSSLGATTSIVECFGLINI